MVDGASIPLPSGLRNLGCHGCVARTTKPSTNITRFEPSMAKAYCFHVCGPVSRARSRRLPAGRSRTRAMYKPSGIDKATARTMMRTGNSHMSGSLSYLELLRPDQGREQVGEQQ